ncbi:MAG: GAP family protein [Patescibacteria group bacterium]
MFTGLTTIPLPVLVGAAIVDSINPCAFGVLVFLLSYLTEKSGSKLKLLLHGLSYIFAVFVTYLTAGFVLMPILGSLGRFSVIAYGVLGIIVIFFGLLEIKDFFFYGKGLSLQMLPGSSQRIKMYVNKISDSLWSAFTLGVFVALVELPCTGAVYLAILSIMAFHGASIANIELLLLYNIIFIAPLVLILVSFVYGIKSETVEAWRKAHKAVMRLMIGLILVALGVWMLMSSLPGNVFSLPANVTQVRK